MKKYAVLLILIIAVATLSGCSEETSTGSNEAAHTDRFTQLQVDKSEVQEDTSEAQGDISDTSEVTQAPKVEEDEQEQVDSIQDGQAIEIDEHGDASVNSEALLIKVIDDVDTSDIDTSQFSELLQSDIAFNVVPEDDAKLCYAVAREYLGEITEFEHSDWLSNTFYTDAYCTIYLINGEHYKFVISDTTIYITDQI